MKMSRIDNLTAQRARYVEQLREVESGQFTIWDVTDGPYRFTRGARAKQIAAIEAAIFDGDKALKLAGA